MNFVFVPANDDSRLDHVGTYKRRVPVSLERMYENALDWAHLAHLHQTSFSDIACMDSGAWGWRAALVDRKGRDMQLELCLDRSARRWITRNLSGPAEGAEIWTHVFEVGPYVLDLVIDFFVPGVERSAREKVGQAYANSYERLYDEDVWMMSERQRQIDRRFDRIIDGTQARVDINGLQLPCKVSLSGREFILNRMSEGWVVYPAQCPHQLGPLDEAHLQDGQVRCPWHGFKFDVLTGERTDGGSFGGPCRLGRVPELHEEAGWVVLQW